MMALKVVWQLGVGSELVSVGAQEAAGEEGVALGGGGDKIFPTVSKDVQDFWYVLAYKLYAESIMANTNFVLVIHTYTHTWARSGGSGGGVWGLAQGGV